MYEVFMCEDLRGFQDWILVRSPENNVLSKNLAKAQIQTNSYITSIVELPYPLHWDTSAYICRFQDISFADFFHFMIKETLPTVR